jgi:hypothetical protein
MPSVIVMVTARKLATTPIIGFTFKTKTIKALRRQPRVFIKTRV